MGENQMDQNVIDYFVTNINKDQNNFFFKKKSCIFAENFLDDGKV